MGEVVEPWLGRGLLGLEFEAGGSSRRRFRGRERWVRGSWLARGWFRRLGSRGLDFGFDRGISCRRWCCGARLLGRVCVVLGSIFRGVG